MKKKVFYLNQSIRRKLFLLELIFVFMALVTMFLLYRVLPYPKSLLILIPIALFTILRLFFFFRNGKALFFDTIGVYTSRSGWVYWREIKDAHIREAKRPFVKPQRCLFFDLDIEDIYEKPLLSVEWPLYLLPSNAIVVCENDIDVPLEEVLEEIRRYKPDLQK